MKVVSNEYKNNIKQMGREINCVISYTQDGEAITLTDTDIISAIYTYNGNILTSVMKELEFEVNKSINSNTIVNLKFGVKVGEEYEYINYGNFIVKDVKENKDTNSYTYNAYDNLIKAMTTYDGVNINFPCSIRDYLIAICNKCSIPYEIPETFINSNIPMSKDYYLDNKNMYTYRDMLDKIAEASGSIICIKDNKLTLIYPTETGESITPDTLSDINVEIDKLYGGINDIVVEDALEEEIEIKDNDSINNKGLFKIVISENKLFTIDNRQEMLNNIYNYLKDISYTLVDIQTIGITYLDLGDIFKVSISNPKYPKDDLYPSNELYPGGEFYNCLMLSDTITIRNGLTETFYSEVPINSFTDYQSATDKTKAKRIASVVVDKALNEVIITGDHIKLEGYTTINDGFAIDFDGSMTCNNATMNNATAKDLTIDGGLIELKDNSTPDVNDYKIKMSSNYYQGSTTDISSLQYVQEYIRDNINQIANILYGGFTSDDRIKNCRSSLGGIGLKCYNGGDNTITLNSQTGSITANSLNITGSKNRIVEIEKDKYVQLGAYETATPYFGDIGSNKTNENGECRIDIDNIFSQTIEKDNYKVFLQECGDGKVYVEKHNTFFVVKGTPNLNFDWEIKAIQKGYKNARLEEFVKEEE